MEFPSLPLMSQSNYAVGKSVTPFRQRMPAPDLVDDSVLQGELLRKPTKSDSQERPSETFREGGRREDHPAFYARYDDGSYRQRQAMDAYQGNLSIERYAARTRPSVDYFI